MIDALWPDLKINSSLENVTERKVSADDARAILATMKDEYEADRAISAQKVSDLDDEVVGLMVQVDTLTAQIASLSPDVTVTVGANGIVSRTIPAVSYTEQTPIWTTPAWLTAKGNIAQAAGAHKVHVYPFGLLDPWISSTGAIDLTTGNRLIPALAKIREVSATAPIILTLYGAPWWMKHTVYNNAIVDVTVSQAYQDSGRVKPSQLAKWLQLVDKCVEAAAAQGCRDFEVWNELKGYYDTYPHVGQKWDAGMGSASVMGYSYFYQATRSQVIATMTRLGIARNQYRIAAPYTVLNSKSTSTIDAVSNSHPLYQYGTTWGYADKMPLNALTDFLANAQANSMQMDVLSLDISTWHADELYATTDPFELNAKFGHYINYVRSILPAYGVDSDIAIDFSEIYPMPQPQYRDANSEALRAALWADCLRQCVLGRVRYPIMWGPTSTNTPTSPVMGAYGNLGGMIALDGAMQKTGQVFQMYRDSFAPGTKVYPLQPSDSRVDGLTSDSAAILFNKTAGPLKVAMGNDMYTLAAYDVRGVTL